MKELRGPSPNPVLEKKEYVTPLWMQEVIQILRTENKIKTAVRSK